MLAQIAGCMQVQFMKGTKLCVECVVQIDDRGLLQRKMDGPERMQLTYTLLGCYQIYPAQHVIRCAAAYMGLRKRRRQAEQR